MFDSNFFIGQIQFGNNGLQNFLISQPIDKNFKVRTGLADKIVEQKSKGFSNEKKPPITENHGLSPQLR